MTVPRSRERPRRPQPGPASEMLRSILSCIGEAVITTDLTGRVTYMNPVAQGLTGWSLAESTGAELTSTIPVSPHKDLTPTTAATRRATRSTAFSTGDLDRRAMAHSMLQGFLSARDGTRHPVEGFASPIRDDAGGKVGTVLVFRDLTESRAIAVGIQDRLVFAQNIIATLREPLLVLQADLGIVFANEAFCRTYRTTAAETVSRNLFDLGSRQWDNPELRRLLGDVLTHGDHFEMLEVELCFPILGPRMMLLNARGLQARDGGSDLILLAMEDVTEARQAKNALEASEVRYRRLFETARDGILILDSATGAIIDANPFMVEMLGYSHAELCGKELWQIGLFSDIEANRVAFAELQAKHYVRYHNLPLQTRTGQSIEVEFVSNVYRESFGTVIQCNIRDHTEHSQLERHSNEQAAALAGSYRRKDEFLAMLSHELRNPLSAVGNAVQMLRLERSDDPLQRRARDIVERQTRQLANLVDDLLEVSRISTGKLQLRCSIVDMREIVSRAVEVVQPFVDARKHQLAISLPNTPVPVKGDPARLEQVIVNLLHNAAKYTDEAGGIWLTLHSGAEGVVLRVRDTGIGIAPDTLPLIFKLFMQAERSLDRAQGGLGVGLTLVQKLVEMHGGTVEAISAGPGQGSEFTVRLPSESTPAIVVAPQGPAIAAPAPPRRVLVVDDNADAADIISMLLTHDGHQVRTAYTGTAALAATKGFTPDFVLLDVGLPDMDGYTVARTLRRKKKFEKVCLVAFTGYGQESDRQKAGMAGFDEHLVKPVEYARLQELLSRASPRSAGS